MSKTNPRLRSGVQAMLPIIAILLGVALAFVRAFELGGSFETLDLFEKRGDTVIVVTRTLTAATVVLFAVFAFFSRPRTGRFAEVYAGAPASKTLYAIGAIGLCAAAVFDYAMNGNESMARVILMAFALFAGAALLFATASRDKNQTALMTLASVFFACFWMVILYRDRTSYPNAEIYIYDMLAVAATVFAFYHASGYAHESAKPRNALFWSLCALSLSVMVFAGTAIAVLRGFEYADVGMIGYHAAVSVWALGACVSLCFTPPKRAE